MPAPNGGSRRPRLLDIAEASGLSRAQVGRALADYGQVSAETRELVLRTAEELGYVPNRMARSMRSQKVTTIGVVVGDIGNSYFARAVRGISDVARDQRLDVLLVNSDENVVEEATLVRALQEAQVGGLIVAPADHSVVEHLQRLQAAGIPVVLFDRPAGFEFDLVVTRNFEGGRMAVDHLWDAGHRDIGVIAAGLRSIDDIRALVQGGVDDEISALAHELDPDSARAAGALARLTQLGARTDRVLSLIHGHDGGRAATEVMLRAAGRPTALIMTSNTMSLGTLEGVRNVGLTVPEDLSLLGFDDLEWATVVSPPLSVIAQPAQEVGAEAVRLLVERMQGSRTERVVTTLPLTLTARGSVGRRPA
jgi:LacI family transcriptional regulator